MRLVCPSCAAEYEVPDEAVPEEGRDVQCGTCGTSWFQERPVAAAPEPEPLVEEPTGEIPLSMAEPVISEDLPGTDAGFADADFETSDATEQADDAPVEESIETSAEPAAAEVTEPEIRWPEPEVIPEPLPGSEPAAEAEAGQLSENEPAAEPEPVPVAEAEPVVEPETIPPAAPIAEPEPEPTVEPEPVAAPEAEPAVVAEAEPKKTERPAKDLDFDFDFEFDDDEPVAAAPKPVAEESARGGRFDKSLHAKPTDGRPGGPGWTQESPPPQTPDRPEPEDLSAPGKPAPGGDEDDLLAAVRSELDKKDDTPKRGETSHGPLTGKRTGVAAAAEAGGIIFDDELEDDEFGFSAQDLGDTLQQTELEDLSAPEPKGSGPQFSIGFATAVILFALAFATYLLGPSISNSYPPTEPYLTSYTRTVDQTRRIVEELSSNALGFAEDKMNENDGS